MKPLKILFATMPLDGHFNPLTGLAVYLREQGHDVRWYTGGPYADKAERLGIPAYRFRKARVINQENFNDLFPERKTIRGKIARLKFDIKHLFILPVHDYMTDLFAVREAFAFDLMVCDSLFCAGQVVQHVFRVPVVSVGVVPLTENSRDLPPSGLGLTPSSGWLGRQKQALLRFVTDRMFLESTQVYNEVIAAFGLPPQRDSIFNIGVRTADVYLQSGVPGFEYKRSDMSKKVRFVGAMLPHRTGAKKPFAHAAKLSQHKKVILATQGTVEQDVEKLLVPTLEAFKDSEHLVVVTTGGSGTADLRARYPQANVIIEDFIDFDVIMPHADVYVTNAGYGGVMLSIQHHLPMVVAGVHEGKSEIAARVGYFGLGENLRTETPTPKQLRQAVEKVLTSREYRQNVIRLSHEFRSFNPNLLSEQYITDVVEKHEAQRERRVGAGV